MEYWIPMEQMMLLTLADWISKSHHLILQVFPDVRNFQNGEFSNGPHDDEV